MNTAAQILLTSVALLVLYLGARWLASWAGALRAGGQLDRQN